MLANFITAAAWLWGGMWALGFAVQFVPPIKEEDVSRAIGHFFLGLPAWAWLIARYCMN